MARANLRWWVTLVFPGQETLSHQLRRDLKPAQAGGLLDVGAASTVCTLMLNPAVLHRVLRVNSILNER